jgi:hypothetical protein
MKKTVRVAQAMRINAVRIACINKAKADLGVPLPKLTAALQKCYDEHFLPVWGYPVKLYNTKKAKPSDWLFIYFDDADAAGAEGYHDITHNRQPVSKVFVKTSLDDNVPVSVTASHELFEMVIDPIANLWAEATGRTEYAYEMCDPVEEDTFMVDGIAMSNFVHPSWFEPFKHPSGTRFDHLGKLKKPFTMTKGGYVIKKQTRPGEGNLWITGQGGALCQGKSARSSQRIPQTSRASHPAEEATKVALGLRPRDVSGQACQIDGFIDRFLERKAKGLRSFHRRPLARAGSAPGFLRLLVLLGGFLCGFLGGLLGFLRRFLCGFLGGLFGLLLRRRFLHGFLGRFLGFLLGLLDHWHGGRFGDGACGFRRLYRNGCIVVHVIPQ